jgi:ribonuclease BN (tRNA processing enzyme)
MATLLFLGSGSAFTVGDGNFHSNMLLTSDRGAKLLIDCGSDIRFSLHAAGLSYRDITDIYISHLHSDHVGGLEYVGISRRFDPQCDRPNLYLNNEIACDIWERTLSGGMRSIHKEIATLETFFQPHPIQTKGSFVWEGIEFELVEMLHVHNGIFPMPTHGLFFTLNSTRIFISSDTQLCFQHNQAYYEQADLIFHDCETSAAHSPVHAHYDQLLTLPAHIRRKLWLYGYQPGALPNAEQDGFCGFVKPGQCFEISQCRIFTETGAF